MTPVHKELFHELQTYALTAPTAQSVMERTANRLHEKMTRYNWAGFYLIDPADPGYLIVGPFAGSFTPNGGFSPPRSESNDSAGTTMAMSSASF